MFFVKICVKKDVNRNEPIEPTRSKNFILKLKLLFLTQHEQSPNLSTLKTFN